MDVMLCKDFDPAKVVFPCATSPKLDGVRAFYVPGEKVLWSRNDKPLYGMDHIVNNLQDCNVVVDMELTVPGALFNTASGIVRSHDKTPQVRGHIIDVVTTGNLVERQRIISTFDDLAYARAIPHYRVGNMRQLLDYDARFIGEGYEGSVVKTLDHVYRNTRSYDWMRIVPVHSIDVKVVGIYEGEGKLAGTAGGFTFVFNDQLCKCGTMLGVTHADRFTMWQAPNAYLGRTAIVEFKELQPSGKPRQPRFKGWRYDK